MRRPVTRMQETYLPALDGLRAVSILLVVVSHLGLDHVVPGAFGVTLFFFISGYLITRQLADSLAIRGRIGLWRFYARRVLRLLPAASVFVLAAGIAYIALGGHIAMAAWLAALFYGANYYDLWVGYRSTLAGVRHPFNILWSLAIEEHFYAVWPLALSLLWRRRAAIWVVLGLSIGVLAWRFYLLDACFTPHAPALCGPPNPNPLWRYNRLYLATDARLDSLGWGVLLALLEQRGRMPPRWLAWPAAACSGRELCRRRPAGARRGAPQPARDCPGGRISDAAGRAGQGGACSVGAAVRVHRPPELFTVFMALGRAHAGGRAVSAAFRGAMACRIGIAIGDVSSRQLFPYRAADAKPAATVWVACDVRQGKSISFLKKRNKQLLSVASSGVFNRENQCCL